MELWSGDEEMKRYASAIIMLVVLCSLAVSGRAMIAVDDDIPGIPSIAPIGYEGLRASIISANPGSFTVDVRKFANIGVDKEAPYFALYIRSSLPAKCGDFRALDAPHWSPSKYRKSFDFRGQENVIKALKVYGCVVLRNPDKPSES